MAGGIREWLERRGLGKYADVFIENDIGPDILPALSDEDLKALGLSLGHRRKLQQALSAGAGDAAPPPPVPTRPSDGERRQVTVLFADIAGFARLSEGRDAEDMHRLLNAFFAAVDEIVSRYGGTIDKHIGDAVMALFGAPLAHTDDPERAVRAALEIRVAVARMETPLQVHVGIASGQVVASGTGSERHREYTVTGESVNLAARLTDRAGTGDILVSDAVRSALGERLLASPLGAIAFEGLIRPVPVWRVNEITAVSAPKRRFVGRAGELAQICALLDVCHAKGRGHTVLIRGEAGIGKTRLVEELQMRARACEFRVETGLILDFGVDKGQDAIRAIVHGLLDLPSRPDKVKRAEAAARALDSGLVDPQHAAHLNDLLNLPQPDDLSALYDAMDNETRSRGRREMVVALARRLSRQRPLLIAVEDLHWADRAMLDYLSALASAIADAPILLLMTTRIDGDPLDAAWRASIAEAPISTIDLGPLHDDDALQLAGDLFDVADQFAHTCVMRAGGNPLFLEQLLRGAEETVAEAVPDSVQSIVQARVDRLQPRDRAALQAASILGQRFAIEAVRYVADDADYAPRELLQHALVRPVADSLLFSHALIRDGVNASLLSERRRQLHARAAGWYESRDAALYAEHLAEAGDPSAGAAFAAAARFEAALFRFEKALELATRGLGVANQAADRHELTCLAGNMLRELGRAEESIAMFERSLEAAGDEGARCLSLVGIAEGMRIVDRGEAALALLEEAQPIAERRDMVAVLTRLHHLRGNLYFPLGRFDACQAEHARALDYARQIGSAEDEARALGGLGDAAYVSGRMRSSHAAFERCVSICRERGFGRIEVANASMIGHCKLYLLQFREAAEVSRAVAEQARRVGHQRAELNAMSAQHFIEVELGDLDAAMRTAESSVALSQRLGSDRFQAEAWNGLARTHLARGDFDQAAEAIAKALEIVERIGLSFNGPRVLGTLLRQQRDAGARRKTLARAEQAIAAGCVGHNQYHFYRDAIDASLEAEDWSAAELYASALESFAAADSVPWGEFYAQRGRLLAAIGRGERGPEVLKLLTQIRDRAKALCIAPALPALESALQRIG